MYISILGDARYFDLSNILFDAVHQKWRLVPKIYKLLLEINNKR